MDRDKRQLPSTERNIKVYQNPLPPLEEKTIPIKKLILFVSVGVALVSAIIAISIIVTRIPKKKDPNEQGYLVNNGYFYPSDDPNNLHKCSLPNCKECTGTISDNKCTKCFDNYTAKYIETDDTNIIKCEPKGNSPPPPSTTEPSNLSSPSTTEPSTTPPPTTILNVCIEGTKEKCFLCNETLEECLLCNPGYFLPSDSISKLTCQSCPIKNCEVCSGSSSNSICSKCEKYTIPDNVDHIKKCSVQSGEGPLCKSMNKDKSECTNCNIGYILEDGKCILNYHFKAIFKTRTKNENVKLIDKYYHNIAEMIVDGKKLANTVKTYTFENKGEHTVYYKIKSEDNSSLVGMFEGLKKMISISFSEKFNFAGIKNMNRMFYNCQSLKNIDLSNINTKNVDMMNYMFYQCIELDSIDLSEVEGENVNDISNMFENCVSVNNIDISNFTNSNIRINDIFKGIPESGTIIVNENLKNKIDSLLPNWEIISK